MVDAINSTAAQTGNSSAPQKERKTIDANYEDFLRLLTTQLKNQDPLEPTDTNQLTQQIAVLSQVEQQINTNKNLEKLLGLYTATQYNSVVSYIGKQIEASGSAGSLQNGKAPFAYYLASEAAKVDITIKNSAGVVVYTGNGPASTGRNSFEWDGKSNDGTAMPNGTYNIEVKAVDGSNNAIESKTYITGIVEAIDSVDGGVYLSFGDMSIPIENVLSIRQPSTSI